MKQEVLYITQNSPFYRTLKVYASDGTPANLTGYTSSMYIAKFFGSETKYAVSSIVSEPALGEVTISINAESTTLLPAGAMQYSIFLKPAQGDGFIILQGQVIVIPSVF